MKKLLTISKDPSIKVNSNITDYLLPSEVFLPINERAKMLVEKKNVKKGMPIYSINDKVYYSSISGKITTIVKRKNYLNQETMYLNIKNDFQENDDYEGMSEFTTLSIRTDFSNKLKQFTEYNWDSLQDKEELIINGIEDQPYLANKPFLHRMHANEILQMIDLLSDTFHILKISLFFKENDRESIEAFNSFIGTYPNMSLKILPDVYPIGNSMVFNSYLRLNERSVVISTEEIFTFYREIVKNKRKDAILVTLTGDAITNPQVINVKIGTLLSSVVSDILQFNHEDYLLFVNSLMNGYISELDNIVLTEDIQAIYFMKKKDYLVSDCIQCGKCNEVCPLRCNPYLSYFSGGTFKNKNCIQCGLCTFICPSKIPLCDYLRGDKNE